MKTLVLGIGNKLLGDDGIGPYVVEEVKKRWFGNDVTFETTFQAGMELVDLVTGYEALVIVDAIQTGGKPGTLYWLTPNDLPGSNDIPASEHKTGILQALKLAESLGIPAPSLVHILAIEAADVTSFSEELSPGLAKVVPVAVREILNKLTGITGLVHVADMNGSSMP